MGWKDFERKAAKYLESTLELIPYVFVFPEGGSDSNLPDVKIMKLDKFLLNIEIKESNSQAGQFVIKLVDNIYEFSDSNRVDRTPCLPVIAHINNNINKYLDVQQSGISVDLTQEQMARRIIYHYEITKNSKFIITGSENDFVVFPTYEIEKYFDIECVVRRKKSGSQDIPFNKLHEIIKIIKENGYETAVQTTDGKQLFVKSDHDLHKKKIDVDYFDGVIYFSNLEPRGNVVKILSKTNNINVIFTLKLKSNHPGNQINKLIEIIKK